MFTIKKWGLILLCLSAQFAYAQTCEPYHDGLPFVDVHINPLSPRSPNGTTLYCHYYLKETEQSSYSTTLHGNFAPASGPWVYGSAGFPDTHSYYHCGKDTNGKGDGTVETCVFQEIASTNH